jgi:hypothetical protein
MRGDAKIGSTTFSLADILILLNPAGQPLEP